MPEQLGQKSLSQITTAGSMLSKCFFRAALNSFGLRIILISNPAVQCTVLLLDVVYSTDPRHPILIKFSTLGRSICTYSIVTFKYSIFSTFYCPRLPIGKAATTELKTEE